MTREESSVAIRGWYEVEVARDPQATVVWSSAIGLGRKPFHAQ
jgi:hypothetical protein